LVSYHITTQGHNPEVHNLVQNIWGERGLSEDGGNQVLWNIGLLPHHNPPEDHDLNLHCCENLMSHILL
jgi:hypothetical protein